MELIEEECKRSSGVWLGFGCDSSHVLFLLFLYFENVFFFYVSKLVHRRMQTWSNISHLDLAPSQGYFAIVSPLSARWGLSPFEGRGPRCLHVYNTNVFVFNLFSLYTS